jgi:putative redox protein
MELVSADFKTIVERMISGLRAEKDSKKTLGTVRADVKLLGQQYQESKVKDFTLAGDEPVSVGGTNRGPTPLDFFASSIGFCENVMFVRHAALLGLSFESLETSVRGHWDRRGQYEIDGTEPSFKDMTVETKVTTKDSVEKVVEVTRLTHRRCPMHATIAKAMNVTDRLFVNGEEIQI